RASLVEACNFYANDRYEYRRLEAPVTYFLARGNYFSAASFTAKAPRFLERFCSELEVHEMPCQHHDMLARPNVHALARALEECLARAGTGIIRPPSLRERIARRSRRLPWDTMPSVIAANAWLDAHPEIRRGFGRLGHVR